MAQNDNWHPGILNGISCINFYNIVLVYCGLLNGYSCCRSEIILLPWLTRMMAILVMLRLLTRRRQIRTLMLTRLQHLSMVEMIMDSCLGVKVCLSLTVYSVIVTKYCVCVFDGQILLP